MLPALSHLTATTRMPASTAEAGFVPCADVGIKHTSRSLPPFAWWKARMTSMPANSPCAPEFGCSETAAKPVISASQSSSSPIKRA